MSTRFISLSPLILLIAMAGSAAAQYTPEPGTPGGTNMPGGYGDPGEMDPGGARMGRGRRGDMGDMPTLSKIEGPASPAIMRDTIGVSGVPADRYAQRYANYMANTHTIRDSLRSSLEAMRTGVSDDDRSAARERQSELQEQWKELSRSDQDFEKNCKDLLTKDQQKRYKKWKDAREKAERERWKSRRARSAGSGQSW